jgi:hypothetical protein
MEESLVDTYWDKIYKAQSPVPALVSFICAGTGTSDKLIINKLYASVGKLNKIYGTNIVFLAMLDCLDIQELKLDNPYPLLSFFCKKRIEARLANVEVPNSLDAMANSVLNRKNIKLNYPSLWSNNE